MKLDVIDTVILFFVLIFHIFNLGFPFFLDFMILDYFLGEALNIITARGRTLHERSIPKAAFHRAESLLSGREFKLEGRRLIGETDFGLG
jgi:hypothetical protein